MADHRMPEKMPEGYDFSSKKVNWGSYKKFVSLRTDAVWEKEKLLDYFRAYYKVQIWDEPSKDYKFQEPSAPTKIESLAKWMLWNGWDPNGASTQYEYVERPFNAKTVSAHTWDIRFDKYELCVMRFERWARCDQTQAYQLMNWKHEGSEVPEEKSLPKVDLDGEDFKNYECYDMFQEAETSCSEPLFQYCLDLYMYRKMTNQNYVFNENLRRFPSLYDATNRRTYTY